ncbi:hypothetical protein BGZ94_002815, partial [Podila epigama]
CFALRQDESSLKLSIQEGFKDVDVAPPMSQDIEAPTSKFYVKWDKSNPEHCVLHKVFGEEYIPLVEGTDQIDYSKVKKKSLEDLPVLDLNVSSFPVEDMIKEVALRIVRFRNAFELWCRWHLTDDLIDRLAWYYMPRALVKAGLAKDYGDLIKELPIEERTWKQVVVCLNKVLKTEYLEVYLADKVLTARPKAGETFQDFARRLIRLVEAANFPGDGCSIFIKALKNHLPDVSVQATLKEYGSFDEIKSQRYGGRAGSQAAERSHRMAYWSDLQEKSQDSYQAKRFHAGDDSGDKVSKKPRSFDRKDICTYSKKCIDKKLRHEREDCHHWQKDQKRRNNREDRLDSQPSLHLDSP